MNVLDEITLERIARLHVSKERSEFELKYIPPHDVSDIEDDYASSVLAEQEIAFKDGFQTALRLMNGRFDVEI